MLRARTSDLWWKNAIIFCLDVETYQDSDGDGTGDFAGLTERLDYLAGLGVTCLWLMPFFPSPNRDDGYDVTDFLAVDPRLGTLGDFRARSGGSARCRSTAHRLPKPSRFTSAHGDQRREGSEPISR